MRGCPTWSPGAQAGRTQLDADEPPPLTHVCPSVRVLDDVDDIAVSRPHQEPVYAPGLGGERVNDLVPELLSL